MNSNRIYFQWTGKKIAEKDDYSFLKKTIWNFISLSDLMIIKNKFRIINDEYNCYKVVLLINRST